MSDRVYKLGGIYILEGNARLCSPAIIGCGQNERTDMDLLLGYDGKPFIPATSFVGVLKESMERGLLNTDIKNDLKRFWGFSETEKISEKEKERGSTLRCSDLYCLTDPPKISIRDGIKINSKSGIVEEKMKYDYEIVERNTIFSLHLEVPYYILYDKNEISKQDFKNLEKDFLERVLATIVKLLMDGEISVGAKTNNGLGKLRLTGYKIFEYDFSKKEDVIRWLKDEGRPESKNLKVSPLEIRNTRFEIDARFQMKNSLIIRSYPLESDAPDTDAVQLQSIGDYIIPGSSWKGAIRARGERILNTLIINTINRINDRPYETVSNKKFQITEQILNELFGYVDKDDPSKEPKRGKVRIKETILPKFIAELQYRIKVDRFTGGTIEGALFDSMPLFNKLANDTEIDFSQKEVHLNIRIENYEASAIHEDESGIYEYEIGLILLILKDLWTGDLAIGGEKNVGRGVLRGVQAIIRTEKNELIEIPEDISLLSTEKRREVAKLEKYVTALVNKIEHEIVEEQ